MKEGITKTYRVKLLDASPWIFSLEIDGETVLVRNALLIGKTHRLRADRLIIELDKAGMPEKQIAGTLERTCCYGEASGTIVVK